MNLEKEVFEISLNDIMPNRFQPREIFDKQALDELAQSIKEHGVIQPIIVRKVGDKYEIVAGERRYRASLLAGKQTIPAIVKDIDDKETAKIALLENLQRKDLTPIEEARTYQTILKLDNLTQEELAINLGKSQSTIANKLRLLNLDEEVQTALLNQNISERHARSLLNIENKQTQRELLEKILLNRMTVKQLDEEIMKLTGKIVEEQPQINETMQNTTPTPTFNVLTPPLVAQNDETPIKNENIFDRMRVPEPQEEQNTYPEKNDLKEVPYIGPTILPKIENITEPIQNGTNTIGQGEYSNIYDLRFAINNFRQAVQNTEKFGFSINVEEFDFENIYQIVIKIDKNK